MKASVESPAALQAQPHVIDLVTEAIPRTPEGISPRYTVLAEQKPRLIYNTAADDNIGYSHALHLATMQNIESNGSPTPAELKAHVALAEQRSVEASKVIALRGKLSKGAVALAFLPGATIGVSAVESFFHLVEQDSSSVVSDASILPGQNPEIIPGIQDIKGYDATYTVTDGAITIETKATKQGRLAGATNNYAQDFKLDGRELTQDMRVLEPVLQFAANNGATVKAEVIGHASDETGDKPGMGLGKDDKDTNGALASARSDVGEQALTEVAADKNVDVSQIDVTSQEDILSKADVAQVDRMAKRMHMTRQELIEAHHLGKDSNLPIATQSRLNELLPRGVEYKLELTKQTQTEVNTLSTQIKKSHVFGIPGELLAAFSGAHFGLGSAAIGTDAIAGRLARRRARKVLKNANK